MPDTSKHFGKLSKDSLSDQLIQRIKDMIASGTLKSGDKLPSERELADAMNISRLPLREALKSLQILNVIELKPGKGYFVKGLDTSNMLGAFESASADNLKALTDLKEVRMIFELNAVELACSRRTEKDILKMKNANNEMKQSLHYSEEKIMAASINFHKAILESCDNQLFSAIFACFKDVQYAGRRKSLEIKLRYENATQEHDRIITAITDRDAILAKQLLKDHLETSYHTT